MKHSGQLAFGPFRLDPTEMQLWRDGDPVTLQRQPMVVLVHLAANAGRVVSSDELLRLAWADAHVSRTTLKVCVRAIRVALGDDTAAPRYVETVGREGYRFLVGGSVPEPAPPAADARPVVGRDGVLVDLERRTARARAGERQLVLVTGEPGIGKTTVVDAFLERLAASGPIAVARAQCLEPYGAGEAYLPVMDILGQLCRAPGGRSAIDVLRRWAPSWLVQMPALVDDAELEALQRKAAGVTGERMLREMADALDALSSERTLVLVFEDLHWSDRATIELLAHVAVRRERARLLLIGTVRPVELVLREHPLLDVKFRLQKERRCTELALELLAERDVADYLAQRLGEAAPEGLVHDLYRRTDGNPLFLVSLVDERLARSRAAAAGESRAPAPEAATVPESLHDLISRQVARRRPEARAALEAASVAGLEFAAAAVAAALDRDLETVETVCEDLAREGHFLRDAGIAEWRDGTLSGRFAFRHALYQEVLYRGIPASRRVRLHRRIAEREELGYGDRTGDIAVRLASQFDRGRDLRRAAHYGVQAGETAMRRGAYPEAIRQLSDAIERLHGLPDSPERTELELVAQSRLASSLMVTQGVDAPAVGAPSARALELSRSVPDEPRFIPVLDGLRGICLTRGDVRNARALAERSLAIAQGGTDVMQIGTALYGAGTIALFSGDFAIARERLERIVQFAAAAPSGAANATALQDPLLIAQALYAGALWFAGFPDEAARRIRETLARADEVAQPYTVANLQLFATMVHLGRDEVDEVRKRASASRAIAREHGLETLVRSGTILEGWVLVRHREVQRGLQQIRTAFAEYEATSGALFRPWFLGVLAQALVEAGDLDEALAVVREALAAGERSGERTCEAELHRMEGELVLARAGANGGGVSRAKRAARGRAPRASAAGGPPGTASARDAAEASFSKAIEVARRQGAKSWELRAATSLARLLLARGRAEEARSRLREIYGWFSEGFETPDLRAARALLDAIG
ncbi:MAG TPA: AAA family ATPase [Candidatus Binatia bacterium]|nr:AAA family ATPase [Candidatus Binatia bacterium]